MPYQNSTCLMSARTIHSSDPRCIDEAVGMLRRGEMVCYPTDTVYGIGAASRNDEAVRTVYAAKGRSLDQPMPLLIADASDTTRYAKMTGVASLLIERFWPGGLTLVMPKAEGFDSLALAGQQTVGLRVPDHDLLRGVIRQLGEPIVGTSANRSGERAAVTAEEAVLQLGEQVPLIIDGGRCRGGAESTVLDITTDPPRFLREGAVRRMEIETVLGRSIAE